MATPRIPTGPLAQSADLATEGLRDAMHYWASAGARDMVCDRSLQLPLTRPEPLLVIAIAEALRIPEQRQDPAGRHRAGARLA